MGIKLAQYEVIKHTAAIHVSNTLTKVQRMASNVLLKNAYHNLLNQEIHRIPINKLAEAIGFDTKNLAPLKDALLTLSTTHLEWNILKKDNKYSWGVTTILAHAKIDNGVCEYSYSPLMREILNRPNIYARLNLLIQRQFTSKHALAIWEYLTELLCSNGFKSGYSEWLVVDEFKKLLGVHDDSYYQEFKNVNRRLIKEPLKEINSVSDIDAKIEYRREKRKVVAIRFFVSRKESYQLPLDLTLPSFLGSDDILLIENRQLKNGDPLLERLLSFGLTTQKAKKFLSDYDEKRITENLDIVEKNCRAGNVANVPAYAMAALKEDYRPKETFLEKEKKAKATQAKAQAESFKRQEIIKNLREEYDTHRLEAALKALPESEMSQLKDEFLDAKKKEKGGDFVLGYYKRNGFDHIVVKGVFYAYAKSKLLKDNFKIEDFASFAESKGYKLVDFKNEINTI